MNAAVQADEVGRVTAAFLHRDNTVGVTLQSSVRCSVLSVCSFCSCKVDATDCTEGARLLLCCKVASVVACVAFVASVAAK